MKPLGCRRASQPWHIPVTHPCLLQCPGLYHLALAVPGMAQNSGGGCPLDPLCPALLRGDEQDSAL